MRIPFRRTRVAAALAGAALALSAVQALATGFQLNENSGSGLGNAFAAGAAFTDDVSAMWWNPAAVTLFPRMQAAAAIHIITPSIKFRDEASLAAANQPLGGSGGDAGGVNFVPNMYFSMPINPQWAFGIGINAPFGLTTEYDDGWVGRYQALKSQIKTINVNPVIAWRPTPQFSFGVGVNYQYLDATLTQNANYSGALLLAAQTAGASPGTIGAIGQLTPGLDSKATTKGDGDAWGWNIGVAWDVTPALRLAASYRSEMDYNIKATLDFNHPTITLPPGTPAVVQGTINALANAVQSPCANPTTCLGLYNRDVRSDITIPEIANFSFLWRVDSRWEVMGDAQFTGWSSIPELRFVPTDGSQLPAQPLNWDDSWKLSLGTSYRFDDRWKLRLGVAFDQTPVTDAPTPRLPDSDRWWLGIGGEYRYSPNLKFDAGFVYIFADSPSFNRNEGNTARYGLLNGNYDVSTTIFSLQGTYTF
jgi:long-chain fatty acid transport protein